MLVHVVDVPGCGPSGTSARSATSSRRATRGCSTRRRSSSPTRWTCRARETLEAFRAARATDGLDVVAISARRASASSGFVAALARLLPDAETLAAPGSRPAWSSTGWALPNSFSIEREPDGSYRVIGRRIERLAAQTDFEREESAERFQRELARPGSRRSWSGPAWATGDTVRFGDVELEWGDEWS